MTVSLRRYGALLGDHLKPRRKQAALLALLVLAGAATQLAAPMLLRSFIDLCIHGAESTKLITQGVLFIGLGLLAQGIAIGTTWTGAQLGWSATNSLRERLAAHLLGLDMRFHNNRTPGELIERIDGDVTAIATFLSTLVIRMATASVLVVAIITLLFIEDWHVGVAVSLFATIGFTALILLKDTGIEATEKEREADAAVYGFVEERLAGIEEIRANGGGSHVMRQFAAVLGRMARSGRRAWMRRSTVWIVSIVLFAFGEASAFGIGVWLYTAGMITIGTVYLFVQYFSTLWGVVEDVIHRMQDLQKAGAALVRVDGVMAERAGMADGAGVALPDGALRVELNGVDFAYAERAPVLHEINLRLAPGRSLGLLGRTGSGKTTLTRLLFRLYDPTVGAVRVGGVDLRELKVEELRRRIAMVTQEVQLFSATVRENLTFFNPEITDEKIHAVIDELRLDEWFSRLPDGLDTQLGTGGGGLSAGEAQLVAFTRVFLRDPGLVILDEPSARMDRATERLLERAMERLLHGRTSIIIAHRLSTVMRADEIMLLDNGRVAEHGNREALLADPNSRFCRLVQTGRESMDAAPHGAQPQRRATLRGGGVPLTARRSED